ncbi:hypothetical protein ACQP0C_33375 [Nocardia sp. CA-129566]|uniref:hypothetical protein n=1 Tax=Nocardia sp. CA-129566 TaxID=3239976 RepID=UPI003D98382B
MNIAFQGSAEYKSRRDGSRFFRRAIELASIEGRHPFLAWSDIASQHPIDDPRTFLAAGEDRDQEILMYRIQNGIEAVFEHILGSVPRRGAPAREVLGWLDSCVGDLDAVVASMIHLSRVRRIGQFYRLDRFLSPHGEVRGHGTGAFSIWTFVLGVFLCENTNLTQRITDPRNWPAFDRDADVYAAQIADGALRTLPAIVAQYSGTGHAIEIGFFADQVQKKFTQFLQSHRGAMRKHSPTSFAYPAPSVPHVTNAHAIDSAIDDCRHARVT